MMGNSVSVVTGRNEMVSGGQPLVSGPGNQRERWAVSARALGGYEPRNKKGSSQKEEICSEVGARF